MLKMRWNEKQCQKKGTTHHVAADNDEEKEKEKESSSESDRRSITLEGGRESK